MIRGIGDGFSSKYITMQIFGSNGMWHIVPLKKDIASTVCFVKINAHVYPFLLDFSKIKTYREKGAKVVQTILYDIEDALPLDTKVLKKLQEYGESADVKKYTPETTVVLLKAAEMLNEPKKFESKDRVSVTKKKVMKRIKGAKYPKYIPLSSVVTELGGAVNEAGVLAELKEQLGNDKIQEPLPEITKWMSDRMLLSPSIIGVGIESMEINNWEWKKIANPAKTPFNHWMLVILGVMLIGGGVIAGVIGYEEGWFNFENPVEDIDWFSLQSQFDPSEITIDSKTGEVEVIKKQVDVVPAEPEETIQEETPAESTSEVEEPELEVVIES